MPFPQLQRGSRKAAGAANSLCKLCPSEMASELNLCNALHRWQTTTGQ